MLNIFCPGRGSNQDLLRGSQTLYRVAIKAGLYRKAVQVCIIVLYLTLPHSYLTPGAVARSVACKLRKQVLQWILAPGIFLRVK